MTPPSKLPGRSNAAGARGPGLWRRLRAAFDGGAIRAFESAADGILAEPVTGVAEAAGAANPAMRAMLDCPSAAISRNFLLARLIENGLPAASAERLGKAADTGGCDALYFDLARQGTHEIGVRPMRGGGAVWILRRLGVAEAHALASDSGLYTLDSTGRFLFANPTMADWIGRSADELVGAAVQIQDFLVASDADDPLRSGVGLLGIRDLSGHVRDLQVSQAVTGAGDSLRIHGVARPVGPAGAAAQRFQRLFREMPVGVALIDRRLRIGDCNAMFSAMVKDEAAIGKPVLDYVAAEDKVAASAEFDSVMADRVSASSLEIRLRGGDIATSVFVGRLQDDRSRPAGLVLLVIDMTEQKNLESQLAQSQKMQAVGQLAGGIAHDFNNVLTAMIGFCDLLLQRHRPGDQSFADIMQIKQNANRAAALVRQLLAFSRQQTLQPRLLNVTEVLAELSNLLRRLLGEKVELSMVHGRDLGLVKGDQGQLEQVMINLAVNARDAMPAGGRLTIRTQNVDTDRPRQAHGEMMPPGEYVLVSVADTGMGIPKDNFARIFEPFFTTKEVGAGTGLGLSTVYGIVKQTGGYLFVDSPGDGLGAVFDIYFRRQRATAPEIASVGTAEIAEDLTGGGTVLLVEDEDPVRLFSARALRNKGYRVVEAKTGEAALELLNSGGPYDLLVTDMVMPRVDGAQVIREARRRMPDLPVICISGYTEDSVLKEVESFDRLRFLSKPFSLKQLASAVKESIAGAERRRVADNA